MKENKSDFYSNLAILIIMLLSSSPPLPLSVPTCPSLSGETGQGRVISRDG